jgi:hypothetical protein
MPRKAPYAAPELYEELEPTSAADQFALAAIAHEWLLGRPFDGHPELADAGLPHVDGRALTTAFARATTHEPGERFASCTAFVDAIAEIANPSAPSATVLEFSAAHDELPLNSSPAVTLTVTRTETPYNGHRIVAALIGGIALGALAMWMLARPNPDAVTLAADAAPGGATPIAPAERNVDEPRAVTEAVINPTRQASVPVVPEPAPPLEEARAVDAAPAAQSDAGLLVHTTPAGATVVVDGVARGTSPIAIRGLDLGSRLVTVSRPGYRAVERQVVLTPDRPSRALEIDLLPIRAAAAVAAPANDGTVVVDSRPAGATVYVDGRPSGVTPLVVTLPPGVHNIRMERGGYRAINTRVDVKAGERTRVAARLEGGQ